MDQHLFSKWLCAAEKKAKLSKPDGSLWHAAITLTRGTFDGNAWSKADVTITGTAVTGCAGRKGEDKCNQGVGNGPEGCDPGNSNNHNPSNDENGGTPGDPGRKGGGH